MIFNLLALSALPALARAQFTAGYFTGWHATEGFPLSSVSWDKYDGVAYAFACVVPAEGIAAKLIVS